MYHNNIIVNIHEKTMVNNEGFDIINPTASAKKLPPLPKLKEINVGVWKNLIDELHTVCEKWQLLVDSSCLDGQKKLFLHPPGEWKQYF